MASRRSHAPSHSRNYFISLHPPIAERSISAVSRGDTYSSEYPLQAPKERSCGINNPPHPLLVPRSGTDYHPQYHTGCVSPPSGNYMGWKYRTYPQLILNLQIVRGCVATAGRHSLLGLHCLLIYNLTDKLQFTCYSTKKNSSRCIPAMAGVFFVLSCRWRFLLHHHLTTVHDIHAWGQTRSGFLHRRVAEEHHSVY